MSDYEDDFEHDVTPNKDKEDKNERSWLNPQDPQERPRTKAELSNSSRATSASRRSSHHTSHHSSHHTSRRSSHHSTPPRSHSVHSSTSVSKSSSRSPSAPSSPAQSTPTNSPQKAPGNPSPTKSSTKQQGEAQPFVPKTNAKRVLIDPERKSKAEAARALLGERSRSKPAVTRASTDAVPLPPKQAPSLTKSAPTARDLAVLQLKNIELEATITQMREQISMLAPQIIRPRKSMSASDSDRIARLQREGKILQGEHEAMLRKIDNTSNVSKVQAFIAAKEQEIKEIKERNKWLEREIRLNSRKLKGGHGITSVHGGHETNVSIDQQKARVAEECKTEAAVWANMLERSKVEAESAVENRERLELSVQALSASDEAPNQWKTQDVRQVVDLHEKIAAKLESCVSLRQRLKSAEAAKEAATAEAAEVDRAIPKLSEVDELRKEAAAIRKRIAAEQRLSVSRSPTKSIKKGPPKPLAVDSEPGPIAGRRARAAKEAATTQGDVTPKKPIPSIAKKVAAAKPNPKSSVPSKTPTTTETPKQQAAPPSPKDSPVSSRARTPSHKESPKSSRASSPIPSSSAPSPTKEVEEDKKKGDVASHKSSRASSRASTPKGASSKASSVMSKEAAAAVDKSSRPSTRPSSVASSRKSSVAPEKEEEHHEAESDHKEEVPHEAESNHKEEDPILDSTEQAAEEAAPAPTTQTVDIPVQSSETSEKTQLENGESSFVEEEVVEEEVVPAPKDEEPSWLD